LSLDNVKGKACGGFSVNRWLTSLALTLLWCNLFTIPLFYGGWSRYLSLQHRVIESPSTHSKVYLVAIVPFTAGTFEEVISRLSSIEIPI